MCAPAPSSIVDYIRPSRVACAVARCGSAVAAAAALAAQPELLDGLLGVVRPTAAVHGA